MAIENGQDNVDCVWKQPMWVWASLVLLLPLIGYIYYFGIEKLWQNWMNKEEYSHGLFIPFLSLFLVWQKQDILSRIPTQRSGSGVVLTVAGILTYFIGEISAITAITQFSLILTLAGLALSLLGWRIFRHIWIAFLFLIFTIPLPAVIYQNLSQSLQLVSSEIGVAVIRLFEISVYLEGNVIDLGAMKLQVVEACSGLRYLFPLMSLAFISAYFYRDKMWKRVLIFLSSMPIAVFMNSLRIGLIGVTVEYWGVEAAEGVLHDFEGWAVFMACMVVLIGLMWLLTKVGKEKKSFGQVFSIDVPGTSSAGANVETRRVPYIYGVSIALLVLTAVFSSMLADREEFKPERKDFASFPAKLGQWSGRTQSMEQIIADRLDFDDYMISTYTAASGEAVSLYIAYYGEQRKGASIHSPRACLPGGGWQVVSLEDYSVESVSVNGQPLVVNRSLIRKGEHAQLVYYWFKQRDRNETGEFAIKWWLFWDALTKNRTDGALVRLVTVLQPDEDEAGADARLSEFSGLIMPYLTEYIPD